MRDRMLFEHFFHFAQLARRPCVFGGETSRARTKRAVMVQLEELEDGRPAAEVVTGTELFARIQGCEGCDRLYIASEVAFGDGGKANAFALLSFGADTPDGFASSSHTHVYLRADNGALITKLRAACDFIRDALARGVDVALVSKEEGEAGAGFVAAAFLILERSMRWEAAVDAVMRARPLNGLKDHAEFMKNVRFLGRNGIPDWA